MTFFKSGSAFLISALLVLSSYAEDAPSSVVTPPVKTVVDSLHPSVGSYVLQLLGYIVLGCTIGGFSWLYHSEEPREGVMGTVQRGLQSFAPLNWFCLAPAVGQNSALPTTTPTAAATPAADFKSQALAFCWFFFGLQVSYLTWGYFQERIMTLDYDGARFKFSVLLVLMNRMSALLLSYGILKWRPPVKNAAPPFKYAMASISNVLSSQFQYEALKFVTFPMQVLSKSCKIVAAMGMGKILRKQAYPWFDYGVALLITLGLFLYRQFEVDPKQDKNSDVETAQFLVGCLLLILYVGLDSFTSNWQSKVFSTHKVDQYQMMFGV